MAPVEDDGRLGSIMAPLPLLLIIGAASVGAAAVGTLGYRYLQAEPPITVEAVGEAGAVASVEERGALKGDAALGAPPPVVAAEGASGGSSSVPVRAAEAEAGATLREPVGTVRGEARGRRPVVAESAEGEAPLVRRAPLPNVTAIRTGDVSERSTEDVGSAAIAVAEPLQADAASSPDPEIAPAVEASATVAAEPTVEGARAVSTVAPAEAALTKATTVERPITASEARTTTAAAPSAPAIRADRARSLRAAPNSRTVLRSKTRRPPAPSAGGARIALRTRDGDGGVAGVRIYRPRGQGAQGAADLPRALPAASRARLASIEPSGRSARARLVASGPRMAAPRVSTGARVLSIEAPARGEVDVASPIEVAARTGVEIETVQTDASRIRIRGRGPAGETVRASLNGTDLGEIAVGADAAFVLDMPARMLPGAYELRVEPVAAAGSSGRIKSASKGSARIGFRLDSNLRQTRLRPSTRMRSSAVAEARSVTGRPHVVIIRRGDNLWRISQRVYGQGLSFPVIVEANRDLIANPDLIFPGQVFVLPIIDRNTPGTAVAG